MIIFGTLLWIDEKNHSSANNKNKKIDSYFRQVSLLAKTLRAEFATELVVITNDKQRILSWFARTNTRAPNIAEIVPSIAVPDGIAFHAAHHKLDALIEGRDLLQNDQDRFILLDTDVVARHAFNNKQIDMLQKADLVVYDISDQAFPIYGASKIKKDVELVANESFVDPRWFGGEMIGGSKKGLAQLIEKAASVLPAYFQNLQGLHHIGDEMYMTSSLNSLIANNRDLKIVNQSPFFIISRHWSRHADRPFAFHMQHSFVHCLGSKPALELLSLFAAPSRTLIYITLKLYHYAVRFYQLVKKIVTRK